MAKFKDKYPLPKRVGDNYEPPFLEFKPTPWLTHSGRWYKCEGCDSRTPWRVELDPDLFLVCCSEECLIRDNPDFDISGPEFNGIVEAEPEQPKFNPTEPSSIVLQSTLVEALGFLNSIKNGLQARHQC